MVECSAVIEDHLMLQVSLLNLPGGAGVVGFGKAIYPSYPPGSDGHFMIYVNLFETCFQILLSYKFNLFTALCYSVENHIPFSQHSSSSAFG